MLRLYSGLDGSPVFKHRGGTGFGPSPGGRVGPDTRFLGSRPGATGPFAAAGKKAAFFCRKRRATAYVYLSSRIGINGDVSLFVRGDSNGDLRVDISDAVAALEYLFLGGRCPCPDAMDANDDGRLDISDPIGILGFLFLGSGSIIDPYPKPGADRTADLLGCLSGR